jgi:hypothetical protein
MALEPYQQEQIMERFYSVIWLLYPNQITNPAHQKCLVKWGTQLGLNPTEILTAHNNADSPTPKPETKSEKIRAVYNLLMLICMDQVIQEEELEIAEQYAVAIGLNKSIIRALFDSILATRNSELTPESMEAQIITYFLSQPY